MAVVSYNESKNGKNNSLIVHGNKEELKKVAEFVNGMYDNVTKDDVDMVNEPPHYEHGMECIDEMILVFGKEAVMNFCLCNVWKYRYRAPYKGDIEENMQKSRWYLNKYKELKGSSTITFNTIEQNDIKTVPLITNQPLPLTSNKVGDYPFKNHVTCQS